MSTKRKQIRVLQYGIQPCLASFILLFLAGPAAPASPGEAGQLFYRDSWAVIIGINDYQHPRIPKLRYAVNDARAIERSLLAQGFRPERIVTLVDREATKARIETTLGDELRQKLGPEDRLLVFFAGHGLTDQLRSGEEEGYLLPVDGDPGKLFGTAISMTALRQISERLSAKHILYMVDACYSGYALFNRSISRDLLQEMVKRPAIQILTAGRKEDQAQERAGHGVFTEVVIQGLQGDAFAGKDWLSLEELGLWVKQRVFAESNKKQLPQYGNLSGEGQFIFLKTTLPLGVAAKLPSALNWQVGDEWSFRWESPRGKGKFVWAVAEEAEINGFPSYVVRVGKSKYAFAKGEGKLGWNERKSDDVVIERWSPPNYYLLWPLEVGKSWESSYQWEDLQNRRSEELTRICTVEATESVTVPAGAFEAFRVHCKNKLGASVVIYWFSPAVKMYVKERRRYSYGWRTHELMSYKLR